jgi:hypothetical protein
VTTWCGQHGGNPRGNLEAAQRGELDHALGLAVEPPVRLVERIHDEPPRVYDTDDVFKEARELAVVAEAHGRGCAQQGTQREQRLEGLGVGNHEGAEHEASQDAKPLDDPTRLALLEGRHLDANGSRDVAPVAQHREGALDAEGKEVAVVRVAARRDEPVSARAEGCAFRVVGLVRRVFVSRAQCCLVLVHTPAQQPQNAFGEALGDVGRRRKTKPQDVLHHVGEHRVLFE